MDIKGVSKTFTSNGQTVEALQPVNLEVAAGEFPDCFFDWVYIDGNHSYEAVRQDLELYWRKLKPGGYIVCDDYHHAGFWDDGVTRAPLSPSAPRQRTGKAASW